MPYLAQRLEEQRPQAVGVRNADLVRGDADKGAEAVVEPQEGTTVRPVPDEAGVPQACDRGEKGARDPVESTVAPLVPGEPNSYGRYTRNAEGEEARSLVQ